MPRHPVVLILLRVADVPREAKIADLNDIIFREETVSAGQITMKEIILVEKMSARRDVLHESR